MTFEGLSDVLDATETEDEPVVDETNISQELTAESGAARKFLTWSQGAFTAACAGAVIVVGSIIGAILMVGLMVWTRRK